MPKLSVISFAKGEEFPRRGGAHRSSALPRDLDEFPQHQMEMLGREGDGWVQIVCWEHLSLQARLQCIILPK